jgi:thiosulfate dehydrogenase [quinone] large subunit
MPTARWSPYVTVYLRLALGITFLAAVADRFGVWGAPGAPNVSWGDFAHFLRYAAQVNAFLPPALIPLVAWLATVLETLLGLALMVGVQTRLAALASGGLLGLFALAMTVSMGVKSALNYSVLSASAGAVLLAASASDPWTLDALLRRARPGARARGGAARLAADRADRGAHQQAPSREGHQGPGAGSALEAGAPHANAGHGGRGDHRCGACPRQEGRDRGRPRPSNRRGGDRCIRASSPRIWGMFGVRRVASRFKCGSTRSLLAFHY